MFRIKKLDIFIAKQFGLLFVGTFFICQFVLMMQFLWRYVDELIGKGLSLEVMAQFFWYMGLMLMPQAFPLAILLSSLITFGNLGESSELTAIKAAGVSLTQAMRSLIVIVLMITGMSLFFIRQRQKEIAIRKVMGSTSGEVLLLMLRTFSIPMLISFVIAVPISWYIMTDWLSNFSYRIALSPWIFAAAGFTCFIISLLTVIIQSWRAASENPINNIKTE